MKRHTTAGLAWLAASTLAAVPACKKTEPPAPPEPVKPAPSYVDHVGPGELVEGTTSAFGLPLPRTFATTATLTYQVSGEVQATHEMVANYVRARVGEGKITMGSTSTAFSHVRPRADPKHTLDIRVEGGKTGTLLVVAEVQLPSEPVPTTKDDALRKAGLGPSGRPDRQMQ